MSFCGHMAFLDVVCRGVAGDSGWLRERVGFRTGSSLFSPWFILVLGIA